jgi:nicotinamide-nucleotide amidase
VISCGDPGGSRRVFPEHYLSKAASLIESFRAAGITIAAAESCTGGLLAGLITAIPGSSEVFDRGFVTYSNAAKIQCLGVPPHILETFGAVSRETALAMAAGALARSNASIAIAITGIAGPGGGTSEKPVGLVHFGFARNGGEPSAVEKHFGALDREGVRSAAIAAAMDLLLEAVH